MAWSPVEEIVVIDDDLTAILGVILLWVASTRMLRCNPRRIQPGRRSPIRAKAPQQRQTEPCPRDQDGHCCGQRH